WPEMPDPFAPYGVPRLREAPAKGARLVGLRLVWTPHDRAESFGLLFAACLCLVALEMKVVWRSNGRHARLATALAGALRTGTLEFASGTRIERPLWGHLEIEEPDEPQQDRQQANFSRYELLAYDATLDDVHEDQVV